MAKKILTIDDHPDTIQLIEMALQRHGYTVIGAYSGPEGLELAEKERPDLILLDMMMPGMDGNAVCRAIRQNPDLAPTPIIMFTAKSQATDKKDSFDAGADDYLTKPTRPSELLQRIEALLARRKDLPSDETPDTPLQTSFIGQDLRFISVLGSRGGAGATTVALNLAATMAEAEVKTILVDLDTQQGHAALYVGHRAEADVLDWLNQPAGALDETLGDYLVEVSGYLSLLPARFRAQRSEARLHTPQMAALVATLNDTGRAIVADLGSRLDEALRPVLQQSDAVVVCLRPERAAIVGAREIVTHLKTIVDEAKLQLVMLDFGEGESMPRPAVESFLGRPLSAVVQLDERALTRAVNRHRPLVHDKEQQQALSQFRRLARQLVPAS